MKQSSAGLLVYRGRDPSLEVFLVHPGGPFWAKKDLGSWSIPKGEFAEDEDPLAAAQREFTEETGFSIAGPFLPLGEVKQPSGKIVHAWAVEASALETNLDAGAIRSNTFKLEWPPKSGKFREFPEVDRAGWFSLPAAQEKLLNGQREFLRRLAAALPPAQ